MFTVKTIKKDEEEIYECRFVTKRVRELSSDSGPIKVVELQLHEAVGDREIVEIKIANDPKFVEVAYVMNELGKTVNVYRPIVDLRERITS